MIHGSMRHYSNGRKKSYNAWTAKKENTGSHTMNTFKPTYSTPPRRGAMQSAEIKSAPMEGVALKNEPIKYTGTLVKGISTMHKSNAVPIIDREQAKEHAKMRR
jgi:hypothetical protein